MFYEIFAGELVELTCTEHIDGHQELEDGSVIHLIQPITISGYLVDVDDDYYYLGEKANEANEAVRKTHVWAVKVIDPTALLEETLKKFPTPTEPNEVN